MRIVLLLVLLVAECNAGWFWSRPKKVTIPILVGVPSPEFASAVEGCYASAKRIEQSSRQNYNAARKLKTKQKPPVIVYKKWPVPLGADLYTPCVESLRIGGEVNIEVRSRLGN